MEKIYVAPSAKRGVGYNSRYFIVLKQKLASYFNVLEQDNRPCLMQGTALLRNAFRADVFLLSFVENIAFQKLAPLQSLMAAEAIEIMHLRGRKTIFIFHNMKPHKGQTRLSRWLTDLQLRHSELVIAHSGAAADYAREQLRIMGGNPSKVQYICHPFMGSGTTATPATISEKTTDILIWGNILPYKGVLEFISSPLFLNSGLRLKILGLCEDQALLSAIGQQAESHPSVITFENRRPGFAEIESEIARSRFVLFPYKPGSISSSGVLMDTLAMGGVPVGPDTGAFHDLAQQGVCLVYKGDEEMMEILQGTSSIEAAVRDAFVKENSWDAFTEKLSALIRAV